MIGSMSEFSKAVYHIPVEIIDLNGKATELEKDLCYYLATQNNHGKRSPFHGEICEKYDINTKVLYRMSRHYRIALYATIVHEYKIIEDALSITGYPIDKNVAKVVEILISRLYRYLNGEVVGDFDLSLSSIYKLMKRISYGLKNDPEREKFNKIVYNMPSLATVIRSQIAINEAYFTLTMKIADNTLNNEKGENAK